MKKLFLGKTDLQVTPLCWGCAPLGNMPDTFGYSVGEDEAIETLKTTFKSPVNFFDTANIYGDSEKRIGKAIKNIGDLPEDVVVATKADRDPKTNEFNSQRIRESVEKSRKRLGIETLPLVYLHDPEHHPKYQEDPDGVISEMLSENGPVAELEKMQGEGIIKYVGISGGPIDMLMKFVNSDRFDVVITHNRWNLVYRAAKPLFELADSKNMGIVNAAPYASGVLATGVQKDSRLAYSPLNEDMARRIESIERVCGSYNIPIGAVALQFSMRTPQIHSTVVGVSSPEQVRQNLQWAETSIPEDLWQEIEKFTISKDDIS